MASSILIMIISIAISLGLGYLSLKYIAPMVTRGGFALNGGLWPSLGMVALIIVGGKLIVELGFQIILGLGGREAVLFLLQNSWVIPVLTILFQSTAIFFIGKFLSRFVFVRHFGSAVVTAVVHNLLLLVVNLVLVMALAGLGNCRSGCPVSEDPIEQKPGALEVPLVQYFL